MVDVRGDVLRPPHGTTPAAVKSSKNHFLEPVHEQQWLMKHFSRTLADLSAVLYRNDPKFSDRYAWANSADPDQLLEEQSDQGRHCLPFGLHLLDSLLYGRATIFKFKSDHNEFFRCRNI